MEEVAEQGENDHGGKEEEVSQRPAFGEAQAPAAIDPTSRSLTIAVDMTKSRNHLNPLASFCWGLLHLDQEESSCSLVDVTIVSDNAAILPDKHTQSQHLVDARNSSSQSSMPELSRWESHVVRTPPANAALMERERERDAHREKAAFHASPTRPQRRTSFEVDRTNDRLLDEAASNNCRKALSQSLTALHTVKPDDIQQLTNNKKTLPPRVPIRRSSGRVHSPPPPETRTEVAAKAKSTTTRAGPKDDNDESNSSFQLEFSESEHNDDSEQDVVSSPTVAVAADNPSVQRVVRDLQSLSICRDQAPNHRRRRGSMGGASVTSSSSDSKCPTSTCTRVVRANSPTNNRARHRRTSSFNDDGLPILESFPKNPPHLRVLPRQPGTLRLFADETTDRMQVPLQTNTAPSFNEEPCGELDRLTKVASSKMLPSRRSFDVGERNPVEELPLPTTTADDQKPSKKGLLKRVKHKVAKTVHKKSSAREAV